MSQSDSRHEVNENGVAITELSGCTVAYLPGNGEAWISGWVDVPP